MPQTREGAARARETEIRRSMDEGMTREQAEQEYTNRRKRIGTFGGTQNYGKPKGFAANPELASRAGTIGGRNSKRRPKNAN